MQRNQSSQRLIESARNNDVARLLHQLDLISNKKTLEKQLLEIDRQGRTPLHWAVEHKNLLMTRILLEKFKTNKIRYYQNCISKNHRNRCISAFIQRALRLKCWPIVLEFIKEDHFSHWYSCPKKSCYTFQHQTLILRAVEENQLAALTALIEKKESGSFCSTPMLSRSAIVGGLNQAITLKRIECIFAILARRYQFQYPYLNLLRYKHSDWERNPILLAISLNRWLTLNEIIEWALARNAFSYNESLLPATHKKLRTLYGVALIHAVKNKEYQLAENLIRLGAPLLAKKAIPTWTYPNQDKKTTCYYSALHFAVINDNVEIAKRLCQHGIATHETKHLYASVFEFALTKLINPKFYDSNDVTLYFVHLLLTSLDNSSLLPHPDLKTTSTEKFEIIPYEDPSLFSYEQMNQLLNLLLFTPLRAHKVTKKIYELVGLFFLNHPECSPIELKDFNDTYAYAILFLSLAESSAANRMKMICYADIFQKPHMYNAVFSQRHTYAYREKYPIDRFTPENLVNVGFMDSQIVPVLERYASAHSTLCNELSTIYRVSGDYSKSLIYAIKAVAGRYTGNLYELTKLSRKNVSPNVQLISAIARRFDSLDYFIPYNDKILMLIDWLIQERNDECVELMNGWLHQVIKQLTHIMPGFFERYNDLEVIDRLYSFFKESYNLENKSAVLNYIQSHASNILKHSCENKSATEEKQIKLDAKKYAVFNHHLPLRLSLVATQYQRFFHVVKPSSKSDAVVQKMSFS